jgi:hypothetical protein
LELGIKCSLTLRNMTPPSLSIRVRVRVRSRVRVRVRFSSFTLSDMTLPSS